MREKTRTAVQIAKRKAIYKAKPTTFIDPFVDFAFKRLFASAESKPILIGLLNHILKGRRHITSIEYGKNDHPGENVDEGGAIFDITCTDADNSEFIIEIQRGYQENFKERALFYASRSISGKAPKGDRKKWAYKLPEVYMISFLENFNLPDTPKSEYIQDICLANRDTGKVFYENLNFIFIEMLNFVKRSDELDTELDKWLYALKHLTEFKKRPEYLAGPEFDQLFNLAKYTNLSKEEQNMYNTSLKYKWDNENVRDYAVKTALTQGIERGIEQERTKAEKEKKVLTIEFAHKLKLRDMPIEEIVGVTGLTFEEVKSLA